MADYAVMPFADYKAACDAVRAKTGGTDAITSGELASQISSNTTSSGGVSKAIRVAVSASTQTLSVAVDAAEYAYLLDCNKIMFFGGGGTTASAIVGGLVSVPKGTHNVNNGVFNMVGVGSGTSFTYAVNSINAATMTATSDIISISLTSIAAYSFLGNYYIVGWTT